jgi:hypothetical protein
MEDEPATLYVRLDETAFRQLVAGNTVKIPGNPPLEIILADIGWERMFMAITDVMEQ